MSDDTKLTPAMTSLLTTVANLNTASKKINTTLKAVEDQLIAANIGLEVWLDAPAYRLQYTQGRRDDAGELACTFTVVGFTKFSDGWHLAARELEADLDADNDEVNAGVTREYPIANASRKDRIAALELLPRLLQALQDEAAKAIQTIEQAQALVLC